MRMHRIVGFIVAGLVALALTAVAAVRICKSCGWEVADDAAKCAHCGAEVQAVSTPAAPAPGPAPAPAEAVPGSAAAATGTATAVQVPAAVVQDQVATARQLFGQSSWWGALLFARNAEALLALRGKDGAADALQMNQMTVECRKRLMAIDQPCPVCDGSGKARMQAVTLKGEVISQEMFGGKCAVCKGKGTIQAKPMLDQLNREEADALRSFALEERKRGLEESHEIWLPAGLADQLTPRETATLRKAFGVTCATCHGFRSTGCATCKGVGLLKCTNKNCVGGIELCSECDGKGRVSESRSGSSSRSSSSRSSYRGSTTTTSSHRCDACNGTGKRACTVCQGRGMIVCTKCTGTGELLCTTCKGTGQGIVCTKCQGDGVGPCTRCRGTGQYRNVVCDQCKGAKVALCKSCLGAGRISRH